MLSSSVQYIPHASPSGLLHLGCSESPCHVLLHPRYINGVLSQWRCLRSLTGSTRWGDMPLDTLQKRLEIESSVHATRIGAEGNTTRVIDAFARGLLSNWDLQHWKSVTLESTRTSRLHGR